MPTGQVTNELTRPTLFNDVKCPVDLMRMKLDRVREYLDDTRLQLVCVEDMIEIAATLTKAAATLAALKLG